MEQPIIRVPTYRLYLDESGDHRYDDLENLSRRYLMILGCVFHREKNYSLMADTLEALKKKYWPNQNPDSPVIFHREDMVRKRPPFHILSDTKVQEAFNTDLLDLLSKSNLTIINVTLDKKAHQERYKYPEHPYHYCLQVMLERYVFWLAEKKSIGDVMGESRGKEDLELKKVYRSIWHDGTLQKPEPRLFQTRLTSKEIKIKPKTSNIPGLQIADLLAYPLKEKLLHEHGIRSNFIGTFSEKVYGVVEMKIRHSPKGKTTGFGEIFLK